jgi:hypothetical protein
VSYHERRHDMQGVEGIRRDASGIQNLLNNKEVFCKRAPRWLSHCAQWLTQCARVQNSFLIIEYIRYPADYSSVTF